MICKKTLNNPVPTRLPKFQRKNIERKLKWLLQVTGRAINLESG